MMEDPRSLTEEQQRSVRAKVWGRWLEELPASQAEERDLQACIASMVAGSCVVFLPGPANLMMFCGLLGNYIGMINVEAETPSFWPKIHDYDIGHVIAVTKGRVHRGSYRSLLAAVWRELGRAKPEVVANIPNAAAP